MGRFERAAHINSHVKVTCSPDTCVIHGAQKIIDEGVAHFLDAASHGIYHCLKALAEPGEMRVFRMCARKLLDEKKDWLVGSPDPESLVRSQALFDACYPIEDNSSGKDFFDRWVVEKTCTGTLDHPDALNFIVKT